MFRIRFPWQLGTCMLRVGTCSTCGKAVSLEVLRLWIQRGLGVSKDSPSWWGDLWLGTLVSDSSSFLLPLHLTFPWRLEWHSHLCIHATIVTQCFWWQEFNLPEDNEVLLGSWDWEIYFCCFLRSMRGAPFWEGCREQGGGSERLNWFVFDKLLKTPCWKTPGEHFLLTHLRLEVQSSFIVLCCQDEMGKNSSQKSFQMKAVHIMAFTV